MSFDIKFALFDVVDWLLIVTPTVGFYNCSMFCCTLLGVHSCFAIILMGKKVLEALLNLSSWCLVIVVWLFLTMFQFCMQFVIRVFPAHTHLPFSALKMHVEWPNKVSKVAKIRNRYNQVPHLTQDTNGKVTNSQKTPQTRAKRSALSQQVTTKHI